MGTRGSPQPSLLPQAQLAAEVAVPVPAPGTFHYSVPPALQGTLEPGHAVCVPFGKRELVGYVLTLGPPPPDVKLKDVRWIAVAEPLFPPALVPLFHWLARYYAHPIGEVLRTAMPAATRGATKKVATLLPAGQRIANGEVTAEAPVLAVVERLARAVNGSLARKTLLREPGVSDAVLRKAERDGLLEVGRSEISGVLAERTESFVTLRSDPLTTRSVFPRPGPVRDRLIDYIDRFGPVGLGEIRDAFPSSAAHLRQLRERDLLEVEDRRVALDAADRAPIDPEDRAPRAATPAQAAALVALTRALGAGGFATFLLHGVTGSGKTEVYLQAAARALDDGGTAIFLVPEIGLTPQFLARFRARFGELAVGVLHSGLTDRERFEEWLRIRRGEARLVIGPRSAVFAPVDNLRLLVVDEEHDGSYKQDDGLRYHARDVAIVRARGAGAVCVLGSATPSLESLQNSREGRSVKLTMPARVADRPMPVVELVDLRKFPVADPDEPAATLSPPLREALEVNHAERGQTILLLNRRGFATTVLCTDCGHHFRCERCDVSMTYHARRHRLLCHYCGASLAAPESCPGCTGTDTLKGVGRGTERLEEELIALWPDIRVDRMDADTTRSRSSHRRILDRFRAGEVDVLIGTQMVAKGHDFPRVTLVGVLHADAALHLPDFRAAERTFQLISQVAGRAGRGDRPGRVLVQTWHPTHHAIRLALTHDFVSFAERELRFRTGLAYPPFARLCLLRVSARDEASAERAARASRAAVDAILEKINPAPGAARVLGPSPAPMYRLQGRFRWQVMIKAKAPTTLSHLLVGLGPALRDVAAKAGGEARVAIDRDPVGML